MVRADGVTGRVRQSVLGAIAFLTILRVPGELAPGLNDSLACFPLVGALCGALAGAVRIGAGHVLGAGPGTVLAITALVLVTGALHQDGLADSADGLGVRGNRERRLAVMRDSSTGAFGVLALIGWALLLVTTVGQLGPDHAFRALVAAGALSRMAILLHALGADPARRDGLGASFSVPVWGAVLAAVITAAVVLPALGVVLGLVAIAVALAVIAVLTWFAGAAYGGRTGDTLGAVVALTELTVCLTAAAWWH